MDNDTTEKALKTITDSIKHDIEKFKLVSEFFFLIAVIFRGLLKSIL